MLAGRIESVSLSVRIVLRNLLDNAIKYSLPDSGPGREPLPLGDDV